MPAQSLSRARRKPSLTALIDVVFILLLFFMVATRFTEEAVLSLGTAQDGGGEGTPRVAFVEVMPDRVRLGGQAVDEDALPGRLAALSEDGTGLFLVPRDGTDMQRLVDIIDLAEAAGIGHVTLEAR